MAVSTLVFLILPCLTSLKDTWLQPEALYYTPPLLEVVNGNAKLGFYDPETGVTRFDILKMLSEKRESVSNLWICVRFRFPMPLSPFFSSSPALIPRGRKELGGVTRTRRGSQYSNVEIKRTECKTPCGFPRRSPYTCDVQ